MSGIITKILNLVNEARINKKSKNWIDIKTLTKKDVEMLKKIIKKDLTGYKRVITVQDINHCLKEHGVESKDKNPINYTDFLLIPLITKEPDKVFESTKTSRSSKLKVVVYKKKFFNTFYYLEEVRTGRKKVALKTLYKKSR